MTTDTANLPALNDADKAQMIRSGEQGRAPLPLKGYATLVVTFNAGAALLLNWAYRRDKLLEKVSFADIAVLAMGSQQLGRMVSKDRVTTGFRKPFTRYHGTDGALYGEDKESTRRDGGELRAAIGELLTCPYCSSVWTTGALFGTYLANHRLGRSIGAFLSTVTLTNFAQKLYRRILEK